MNTASATENAVLMSRAREALRGKWGLAIGAVIVFEVIVVPLSLIPIIGFVISTLISGPFLLGLAIFFLAIARRQDAKLSQIFDGFNKFGTAFVAYLVSSTFILLWTLLLIVPGIIAVLAYSQMYYIISESDSISALDAITKSKKMMMGNKSKLFCLFFRFFGWGLLCLLTLGIGFLWLIPYMNTSLAQFHDDLIEPQEAASAQDVAAVVSES